MQAEKLYDTALEYAELNGDEVFTIFIPVRAQ